MFKFAKITLFGIITLHQAKMMFYLISNQYGFRSWFSRCFSSWLFWCLLQNLGCPMVLKCMSWFLKTNGVYLRFLFNVSLTESSRFVRIFFMSWCDSAEDFVLIKVIYFCYASQHMFVLHIIVRGRSQTTFTRGGG